MRNDETIDPEQSCTCIYVSENSEICAPAAHSTHFNLRMRAYYLCIYASILKSLLCVYAHICNVYINNLTVYC